MTGLDLRLVWPMSVESMQVYQTSQPRKTFLPLRAHHQNMVVTILPIGKRFQCQHAFLVAI